MLTDNPLKLLLSFAIIGLILILAAGCSDSSSPTDPDDPNDPPDNPNLDTLMSVAPAPLDSIDEIVGLGNLNPSGHTFPTDHIYFYMMQDQMTGIPHEMTWLSPGTLEITRISASHHVNANFTDFDVTFELQEDVDMRFAHISSLRAEIFGNTTDLSGWTLENEYTTGGETYQRYGKNVEIVVNAGDTLGTVGGNAGQYAFDLGVYDHRDPSGNPVNLSAWSYSDYMYAACPFDYYEDVPVRDSMIAMINRSGVAPDPNPCGLVVQDVQGTAQGIWFSPGASVPYPEDPHLALVWHNIDAGKQAFSVGNSLSTTGMGVYVFEPTTTGRLNREFDQVEDDGTTYGYTVSGPWGGSQMTILISVPHIDTLYIEGFPGHITDTTQWVFTAGKSVYVR